MDAWYYEQNGTESGPCSLAELQHLAARHIVVPTTLVRREGSNDRRPAREIEELFPSRTNEGTIISAGPFVTPRRSAEPNRGPALPAAPPRLPQRTPPPPTRVVVPPLKARVAPTLTAVTVHLDDEHSDDRFRRRWLLFAMLGLFLILLFVLILWFLLGEPGAIIAVDAVPTENASVDVGAGTGSGGNDGVGSAGSSGEGRAADSNLSSGAAGASAANASDQSAPRRPRTVGIARPIPTGISLVPPDPTPAVEASAATADSAPSEFGGGGTSGGGGGVGNFFGVSAAGSRFVYVVDCSGSMSGRAFEKTCAELLSSVGKLGSTKQFFVVFYSDRTFPQFAPVATNAMLPATKTNIEKLRQWVAGMQAGGGTEPRDALMLALQLKPSAVFFLTDGNFEDAVAQQVNAANTKPIPINTIAFLDPSGERLLKQIAAHSRGKHRFVK